MRISGNRRVCPCPNAACVQLGSKGLGSGLPLKAGDNNRVYIQPACTQVINEAEDLGGIGVPEVAAFFAALNVTGVYTDNDFGLVTQCAEQFELGIFAVAGQAAFGVHILHQLAAEFQI